MANLVLIACLNKDSASKSDTQFYKLASEWNFVMFLKFQDLRILLGIASGENDEGIYSLNERELIKKTDLSAVAYLLEIVNCNSVHTEANIIFNGFKLIITKVPNPAALDFIIRSIVQVAEIQNQQNKIGNNNYFTQIRVSS